MRYIYLLIIAMLCLTSYAQFAGKGYKEVEKLKSTTTYVVLADSDDVFNKYIKEAVTEYWKFTKYDFITYSQLEEYSKDEKKSFILITEFSSEIGGNPLYNNPFYSNYAINNTIHGLRTGTTIKATYGSVVLTVILGGKMFTYWKNWLSFCYGGYGLMGFSSPKIIGYIKMMQNTLYTIEKNKLNNLLWNEADKYYNQEGILSGKQILFWDCDIPDQKVFTAGISKENTRFLNESEIKKYYSGKFKIVKDKELEDALKNVSPDNLFFGSYFEGTFNVIYLFDGNGNVVYFSKMMYGYECTDWFELVLKKLNRAYTRTIK